MAGGEGSKTVDAAQVAEASEVAEVARKGKEQ